MKFLVLALPVLAFAACGTQLPLGKPMDSSGPKTRLGYRFLALGDSYTIGESVEYNERWPVQLADMLRGEGIPIDDPLIIARTGWTTDELNDAIDAANPAGTYDLISLLIGVNNQYRGRSAEEYRGEFKALLQRATAFAGGKSSHVIVLSIPDWGVTPFAEGRDRAAIAREIDQFNSINKEESRKAGALYVDVTPVSRLAPGDPALVAPDGLHPSGRMYLEWVRLAYPLVKELLNQPKE